MKSHDYHLVEFVLDDQTGDDLKFPPVPHDAMWVSEAGDVSNRKCPDADTVTLASPGGIPVDGIELRFEAGHVVEARAERGEEYLRATLATDAGASRLGEIGIGTNVGIDRPVGMIRLDEKIGGTVHLAVGRSYPETGGTNESAVHWDMICDLRQGGRLSADGEPLVEDGRLV